LTITLQGKHNEGLTINKSVHIKRVRQISVAVTDLRSSVYCSYFLPGS